MEDRTQRLKRRQKAVGKRVAGTEEQRVMAALTTLGHGPTEAKVPSSSKSLIKLAVCNQCSLV